MCMLAFGWRINPKFRRILPICRDKCDLCIGKRRNQVIINGERNRRLHLVGSGGPNCMSSSYLLKSCIGV